MWDKITAGEHEHHAANRCRGPVPRESLVARVLELQRQAGNRATAALIKAGLPVQRQQAADAAPDAAPPAGGTSPAASTMMATPQPLDPPDGVQEIRKKSGVPLALGYTYSKIEISGGWPMFELVQPTAKAGDQFIAKVAPTTAPWPYTVMQSWYPAPGLHKLRDLPAKGGKKCADRLDVSPDRASQVMAGEQEHLDDRMFAYLLSLWLIAAWINYLATQRMPGAATPEQADLLARKRFLETLPKPLVPTDATRDAQLKKWTQVVGTLSGASRKRDLQQWHSLGASFDHRDGCDVIDVVSGTLQLHPPAEFMVGEFWALR